MKGFRSVVEAVKGHSLFGGRMVEDGPVFERFGDALYVMNEWIRIDQEAGCLVKLGRRAFRPAPMFQPVA